MRKKDVSLWYRRDAKKAYQSRVLQQERLATHYLKIGLSTQIPYSKRIRRLFQIYGKNLELLKNMQKINSNITHNYFFLKTDNWGINN